MTHTGEKNVTIPSLAYTFASSFANEDAQSSLYKHMLTHSEVRPYNCNQCIKTFKRNSCHKKHSSSQAQMYEHRVQMYEHKEAYF